MFFLQDTCYQNIPRNIAEGILPGHIWTHHIRYLMHCSLSDTGSSNNDAHTPAFKDSGQVIFL